jgi:LemA protein
VNGAAWLLFGLAALLLFWTVGARRRLAGLRQELLAGWARIAEVLAARDGVAEPLVSRLRGPLSTEQGALDGFLAAAAQARQSAAAVATRPLDTALLRQWAAAEATLAAAATRLLALVEQQPALLDDAELSAGLATWREAGPKLAYARQRFNEAAAAYDAAITLFPTSLLARLGGQTAVGSI